MRNVDGNGATTRMKTLTDDQRIVYLYWRTVKSHAICGEPVTVLFWLRELPAKSLAPVVTTAL